MDLSERSDHRKGERTAAPAIPGTTGRVALGSEGAPARRPGHGRPRALSRSKLQDRTAGAASGARAKTERVETESWAARPPRM